MNDMQIFANWNLDLGIGLFMIWQWKSAPPQATHPPEQTSPGLDWSQEAKTVMEELEDMA